MLEFILELVLELFGEVLLQILFQALAEVGLHMFKRSEEPVSAITAAFGYLLFGAIVGGLSLLVMPTLFMHTLIGRVGNLVLAPIAAGLSMCVIGAWREKRHDDVIRMDRFSYGWLFAMGMAAVRFAFGK